MFYCALTGHRPDKLGGYGPSQIQTEVRGWMRYKLATIREEQSNVTAISGMALGCDTWWAEECLLLGVPFIAAVPFKGQECRWPAESQGHYKGLLNQASEIVIVCEGGYAAWKMQKRNEWVCTHTNILLAIFDGTPGGTANCIGYAKSINLEVVQFNPKTHST